MLSRRRFLAASLATGSGLLLANRAAAEEDRALVAVTLDLEMSRNFPTWEQTEWDYQKGNLNDETKKYAVEAARRVKAAGGVLHFFALGSTLEQPNVDWLKQLVQAGHPVGNHTYDHVNVTATKPEDIQFRFRRSPWLIDGKEPRDVIRDNIRLTSAALKTRVGIDAAGFRTPGGFAKGLKDHPEVQQMLTDLGFTWVSSLYPPHPVGEPGREPPPDVFDAIVKAQATAQPFVYPGGLVEVPMSPISDIGAFRNGRWKLEWFLKAIRAGVEWAIDNRAVFDFLGHPSCLYVTDPEFRTVELICDLVKKAGKHAALVDLGTIAERSRLRKG
ncbi:MAG TPA: polysaccharide deacetylase family protein, partial [Gemmataceae bacterium]|nr:polysaccharide deacetylase family protein [Gemmataceae bacterium]